MSANLEFRESKTKCDTTFPTGVFLGILHDHLLTKFLMLVHVQIADYDGFDLEVSFSSKTWLKFAVDV